MKPNELQMLQDYMSKYRFRFQVLLAAVTLVELVLLVRGLTCFNLERLKLRLYVYSYAFLFATSLAALVLFSLYSARPTCIRRTVFTVYAYSFCFILWATGVTSIDCMANGDSGIMVYVMICIAVGGLTLIKPWVFAVYTGISGAFLLVFTAWGRGWEPYSGGFYLNFVIFLATAIFVNIHCYRLTKREFESRQALEVLSYTDWLTGIGNRRSLEKHMNDLADSKQEFTFVMMDIDDFKIVNDTYGHMTGDDCLKATAQVLTAHFGQEVYRLGGDEFALLTQLSPLEVCQHMQSICAELSTAVEKLPLRISAGVSTGTIDAPDDLLSHADQALYQAKKSTGERWAVYTGEPGSTK